MKTQDEFVSVRSADWQALDELLKQHEDFRKMEGATVSRAAALYRAVCADITYCRAGRFTPDLTAYLDGLAARAHAGLYGFRMMRMPAVGRLLTHEFPQTLRANGRFFLLSVLLFMLPWVLGFVQAMFFSEYNPGVVPEEMLDQMSEAYSEGFSGRPVGTNTGMAGFYVYNNVGIAFRCFATGIFFGLGSIFFLVYNGLVTGTVIGHVTHAGFGGNIFTFICGHSPFEITAIFISGAAGLRMGHAVIETGGLTRSASLRKAAPELGRLIAGAALMLFVAALVEGFWSPSGVSPVVKWVFAAAATLLVTVYLGFAGRNSPRKVTS